MNPEYFDSGFGVEPVRIVRGAFNGRSNSIASGVARTQRYIARAAATWHGSQDEYNAWARAVMTRSMRGMAEVLCVEALPQGSRQ